MVRYSHEGKPRNRLMQDFCSLNPTCILYVFIGSADWAVNRVICFLQQKVPAQWIFGNVIWLATLCFVYKWAKLTDQIKDVCFLNNPIKILRFRPHDIKGNNYCDCSQNLPGIGDKKNTSLLVSLPVGCKLIYLIHIYHYTLKLKAGVWKNRVARKLLKSQFTV